MGNIKKKSAVLLLAAFLALGAGLAGCSQEQGKDEGKQDGPAVAATDKQENGSASADNSTAGSEKDKSAAVEQGGASLLDVSDLFSSRDLEQVADTAGAEKLVIASGADTQVSAEGVYVVSGSATDSTIVVDAADDAKVQLVLDDVTVSNTTKPAIYVKSADKVFVTTLAGTTSSLASSEALTAIDGDEISGTVYSKDDITFNGQGKLVIKSADSGIVGKDEVVMTGGEYDIDASAHAVKGKDDVAVADGTYTLKAGKDGIHSANSDNPDKGFVYVAAGTFDISAGSDGIEGSNAVQIDDGTMSINASEGIESTYVQINGGKIAIKASDDGINVSAKSTARPTPTIEINGGEISIDMGQGDTDALDSNGALYINGGTVDINAQFAFDFGTEGKLNGGTVTVNGEQVTEITESMQMGGGMGGMFGRDGDENFKPDGDGQAPDMGDVNGGPELRNNEKPAKPDGTTRQQGQSQGQEQERGQKPQGQQPGGQGISGRSSSGAASA